MTQRTREQMFIDEGLDAETARIAAEASYLPPKERTEKQQQAITKASKLIAENNRELSQAEDEKTNADTI